MTKIQKNNLLLLPISHFTYDNIELRMTIITVTTRQVAFGLTLCYADL